MRDSSLISVVSAGEGDGTSLWFGSSLESARHMEAAPSVRLSGRSLTDGGSVWEEGCRGLAQALLSLRTVEPWQGTSLFFCGNCCGVNHPRLQRADTRLLILFCLERTLKTKSLSAIISVSQKGG